MLSTWLDEHLETFVRPVLKTVPSVDLKHWQIKEYTPRYLLAIRGIWKEAKKLSKGRVILLAGRDVFLFEVLAKMEGYYTIFRPDISSTVAPFVKEDYKECYLLDTGYRGTVPKALGIENFGLISYKPFPVVTPEKLKRHQVFPRAVGGPILGLASMLETAPKYWYRGTVSSNHQIVQSLADTATFSLAAMLTQHVARSVSKPKLKRTSVKSVGRGI